jgi:[acyl-carrier-protein] S-malonyltransferase
MLDALPQADTVARLLDAAEALGDIDLRAVAGFGTPAQLADTRAAQPLLFLTDWAWGAGAIAAGVTPTAVAGHSLGEFAALAVAGVFSVEAGLELVIERARLMATRAAEAPGAMTAVLGLDSAAVAAAIRDIEGVWVANDNAPGQIVVSGTVEGVAAATPALTEAGARRIVPLQVSGAFHSPLMTPAAAEFADLLRDAAFADATYPVYQNSQPTPARDAAVLRERLIRQIDSPVRWTETMYGLRDSGVTKLLECGPGSVLTGLARRVEGIRAYAVEDSGIERIIEEDS